MYEKNLYEYQGALSEMQDYKLAEYQGFQKKFEVFQTQLLKRKIHLKEHFLECLELEEIKKAEINNYKGRTVNLTNSFAQISKQRGGISVAIKINSTESKKESPRKNLSTRSGNLSQGKDLSSGGNSKEGNKYSNKEPSKIPK